MNGEHLERVEILGESLHFVVDTGQERAFYNSASKGKYEPKTFQILDCMLTDADTAVDVGAEAGLTTLFMATKARSVVAVEPSPEALGLLERNVSANSLLARRVLIVHAFLWSGNQEETFSSGSFFDPVHFTVPKSNEQVRGITIEVLLQELAVESSSVKFMNIDVEGAEYFILPAMKDWLRSVRPALLISLHPGFLTSYQGTSFVKRIFRLAETTWRHLKLIFSLGGYPYVYDVKRSIQVSLWRLITPRFLRGQNGNECQLLLSTREWHVN